MASPLIFRIAAILESQGFKLTEEQLKNLNSTLQETQKQAGATNATFGSMATLLKGGLSVAALVLAVKDVVGEFIKADAAATAFSFKLKALGQDTRANEERVKAFSDSIQATTQFENDVVLKVLGDVITRTGDLEQSLAIVKTATDLAAAGDGNLASAADRLSIALTTGGRATIQLGREFGLTADQSKDLNLVMKTLQERVGGAATNINSAQVQLLRMKNEVSDLKELLGAQLAPIILETSKSFLIFGKDVIPALIVVIDLLSNAIQVLRLDFSIIKLAIGELVAGSKLVKAFAQDITGDLEGSRKTLEGLEEGLKKTRGTFQKEVLAIADSTKPLGKIIEDFQKATDAIEKERIRLVKPVEAVKIKPTPEEDPTLKEKDEQEKRLAQIREFAEKAREENERLIIEGAGILEGDLEIKLAKLEAEKAIEFQKVSSAVATLEAKKSLNAQEAEDLAALQEFKLLKESEFEEKRRVLIAAQQKTDLDAAKRRLVVAASLGSNLGDVISKSAINEKNIAKEVALFSVRQAIAAAKGQIVSHIAVGSAKAFAQLGIFGFAASAAIAAAGSALLGLVEGAATKALGGLGGAPTGLETKISPIEVPTIAGGATTTATGATIIGGRPERVVGAPAVAEARRAVSEVTNIDVGTVSVNVSVAGLNIETIDFVARELGEAVRQKTIEAVVFAKRVFKTGQEFVGEAV